MRVFALQAASQDVRLAAYGAHHRLAAQNGGAGEVIGAADGRACARKRDQDPPREAEADLKAGRSQIHGLLLDPPEYVLTAKVFDLLLAVPKYGRVKVNRILTHCRISPSKTIGGLSERQRNELVSYLRR